MTPAALSDILAAAFAARRPTFANERDLQRRIRDELHVLDAREAIDVYAEYSLARADRPDFFVTAPGADIGTAVEVKVKGSLSDLTRQVFRYAEHPTVSGILVVTTKHAHRNLPAEVMGKPLAVFCLADYLL